MNGTVKECDVWVPMDAILGGQGGAAGWHMTVECLAEGRRLAAGDGHPVEQRPRPGRAYARARKQFKVPIGGRQEALALMASDGTSPWLHRINECYCEHEAAHGPLVDRSRA